MFACSQAHGQQTCAERIAAQCPARAAEPRDTITVRGLRPLKLPDICFIDRLNERLSLYPVKTNTKDGRPSVFPALLHPGKIHPEIKIGRERG